MITLAPKEAQVLEVYRQAGNMKSTSEICEMSIDSARRYMIALMNMGLAKKLSLGRYEVLDVPYEVKTFHERMEEKKLIKHELPVTMSEYEKAWMLEHYKKYQKNRSEAARILGRTRFEICLMAQVLKINLKEGDYGGPSKTAKRNKSA